MATAPNVAALEARIRTIKADRDSATTLLRDKSFDLTMAPGSTQLRAEVETLEREIAGHDRELGRLEAAIHELRRRGSAAERRKRLAELSEHRQEVTVTGKRMAALSEKLLAHVEAIGPMLSEFATLSDTHRELCRAVMRGNLPSDDRSRYDNAMSWRAAPVSASIAAALWRAGVGRLGLDLDPFVSVVPPRAGEKGDRYVKGDLLQILREDIAKCDELLTYGLAAAIKAATDELATDEQRAAA
ncbi:hypothetical protein [Pseudaquabacterium pictum]|uniref:Uncharacterized protein n=1 Tax=Pseudaquabacterium pictum TaxID=2315236 RepID=A0A480AU69_9BURK|nr:hypothetical protein [Rubrivivax pictus]GCL64951.1 hypothetical protein AQPW35_40320 [Rubrivivax pictus]